MKKRTWCEHCQLTYLNVSDTTGHAHDRKKYEWMYEQINI